MVYGVIQCDTQTYLGFYLLWGLATYHKKERLYKGEAEMRCYIGIQGRSESLTLQLRCNPNYLRKFGN